MSLELLCSLLISCVSTPQTLLSLTVRYKTNLGSEFKQHDTLNQINMM